MISFVPKHKSRLPESIEDRDFSRDRRLTLPIVLALLLNMVRPGKRDGYQILIDRFFHETGRVSDGRRPPDKAAFHRARKKVPLHVMTFLFEKAVRVATDLAAGFESILWKGRRVLAIDGTRKNTPRSGELAAFFGIPDGGSRPQMLACTLYDVLARIPLNGVAAPHDSSERALATTLLDSLRPTDLVLLDRGFPGFRLLHEFFARQVDFLVRLPAKGLFGPVKKFLATDRDDAVVTIHPAAPARAEYREEGLPVPGPLTLRVVRTVLPNGASILLATSLLDRELHPAAELIDLYHLRWEEEEYFKLIKGLLEAENFRGKSVHLVSQELIAIHLYVLLTRILCLQAAAGHNIHPHAISQKHAFLAVARFLDHILLTDDPRKCQRLIRSCIDQIAWNRYKKRPDRSYPRKLRR